MEPLATNSTQEKKASFLKDLRSATGPKHMALESNDLLATLTSDKLNLHRYHNYLVLMKEIEVVYALMVEASPMLLTISGKPNATTLITQDLAAIGTADLAGTKPFAYKLAAENRSVAFLLGFCYVMKGSKLGGKVIYKYIHRHLGLSEQSGAGYILDAGNDTFGEWKKFLTALSDFAVENNGAKEIIAGAIFGFSSINDYFESNRMIYAD